MSKHGSEKAYQDKLGAVGKLNLSDNRNHHCIVKLSSLVKIYQIFSLVITTNFF